MYFYVSQISYHCYHFFMQLSFKHTRSLKTPSESFDSFEPKCVTTRTKRLIFHTFLSHFVRVLTHYGSNESNDSLRFFCELNDLHDSKIIKRPCSPFYIPWFREVNNIGKLDGHLITYIVNYLAHSVNQTDPLPKMPHPVNHFADAKKKLGTMIIKNRQFRPKVFWQIDYNRKGAI